LGDKIITKEKRCIVFFLLETFLHLPLAIFLDFDLSVKPYLRMLMALFISELITLRICN
jgi:hypothetical protein